MLKIKKLVAKNWTYILLLAFSFLIIFPGLTRCLPMRCYADESIFVTPAISFWKGNFDKTFWGAPGHTIMHLVYLGSLLIYVKDRFLLGRVKNIQEFVYLQNSSKLSGMFLMGRIINALIVLCLIFITFKITKIVSKNLVGHSNNLVPLMSAILLCINEVFLIFSKTTRMDMLQTTFNTFGLLLLIQGIQKPSRNFSLSIFFLFGLSTGLATMSKWPGIIISSLLIIPFLKILVSKEKLESKFKKISKLFLVFLIGLTIGLFLGSPTWIFHLEEIKGGLITEAKPYHLGADNLGFWGNLLFYQKVLISSSGILIYALFVFEIIIFFLKKKNNLQEALVLLYFWIYLLSISYLKLHWDRWLIPTLPPFIILSSIGMFRVTKRLSLNKKVIVIMLVFITPLTKAFFYNLALLNGDTRVLSKNWINRFLKKEKIAYEGYTARYPDRPLSLAGIPIIYYQKAGFKYLVVSSAMYDRFLKEPERYQKQADFYQDLFQNHRLIISFPTNPIPQTYQKDFLYDWDFWRLLITNPKRFLTLPAGPEIRVYQIL